ncbi:MAG TPA: SAM-dependent methyltransferase [Polyangiaceae bacterium]|nr:SAM-dependent methyltransferase [Polyangiaceae bacterium]
MQRLDATGYLAPEERVERVTSSLGRVQAVHGRLVIAEGPPQPCPWAQNVWLELYRLQVKSIRDAVAQLCALQRNWWPYSHQLHRRSELTKAQLPFVAAKPLEFPVPAPEAPLGSFCWLENEVLLCSPRCTSPFPNGEPRFVEFSERQGPPSRAYLKLFEALTLLGAHPAAGERCLEIGASPGGWTWVLGSLGARVLAVDRAPLAANVSRMANVEARVGNAFAATPERIGAVDWLFSDVICYPEKLYDYVRLWLDSGRCRKFVCTLKFQGAGHYDAIERFAAVPGSRLVHLFHNRHELTWMRGPEAS